MILNFAICTTTETFNSQNENIYKYKKKIKNKQL